MASSSSRHRSRTAQLRHYTSHPGYHVPTTLPSSTTYILTVSSSKTPSRQIISSPRALRAELEAQQDGVLVIKGKEGWRMADVVGIDLKFLEGAGGRYRGRDGFWWQDVGASVGVHVGGCMPVMVIDESGHTSPWSRMRDQDIMRYIPGNSRAGKRYGAKKATWDIDSLEEKLAEEMETMGDLPQVICDVVYERWAEFLLSDDIRRNHLDWTRILQPLERNAETARRGPSDRLKATYTLWTDLITRTTLRHILLSSSAKTSSLNITTGDEDEPTKTPNERSLDRVTYLGGLLLPLTVVSSILAIEGPYGPTGDYFWVFWVASGISSLLAVAVIYIDQMRRVDVWVEAVVTGDGVTEMGLGRGVREMRWKRGELGWKGAVKRVSGMEKWWPSEGVRFQRPAVMDRLVMDV